MCRHRIPVTAHTLCSNFDIKPRLHLIVEYPSYYSNILLPLCCILLLYVFCQPGFEPVSVTGSIAGAQGIYTILYDTSIIVHHQGRARLCMYGYSARDLVCCCCSGLLYSGILLFGYCTCAWCSPHVLEVATVVYSLLGSSIIVWQNEAIQ